MFGPMPTLTDQFQDAVNAFLRRTGTPASRLGARVLRDPSFVSRLRRGRVPNLDTVDRVLLHIGEAPLGPAFRAEVDTFLGLTRIKDYLLGMEAVGDPTFVSRLREGVSPRLGTVERVRRWIADHCGDAERKAIEARTVSVFCPLFSVGKGLSKNNRSRGNKTRVNGKHNRNNGNKRGNSIHNNQRNNRGGNTPMKEQQQHPKYLDTREAADFLGLSNRTLDRYRVTGEGPIFHKFGNRIRYALADLEAWATARRVRSTSEADLGAWRTA